MGNAFSRLRCHVYGGVIVAISDDHFRLGVAAGAVALVAGITVMRFCGSMPLPPKPPPPSAPTGPAGSLVARGAATPAVYQEYLTTDAAQVGIPVPSLADMGRALPHDANDARHVLEVGQPAIDVAGLRMSVARANGALVLAVENPGSTALAYLVESSPIPNVPGCDRAAAIPHNAMVVAKGATERRAECVWRDGMALVVTRVETVAVPPLSAFYLSQLPPRVVGLPDRIARSHVAPETPEKCSSVVSQTVKSGLERGQIGWRDLVDFYARHRCQTYRFPMQYRAFKSDGERPIPAVGPGQ